MTLKRMFICCAAMALVALSACTPKEFVMKQPPVTPTAKQYPKADAVVLLDRTAIRISDDGGTFFKDVHVQIKALNKRGTRYLRGAVVGDSLTNKVSCFRARLLRPHDWISNASRPRTIEYSGRGAKFISAGRIKVLGFSKPLPGSVLEYRYTITGPTWRLFRETLQWKIPVLTAEVTVSVPQKHGIRSKIYPSINVPLAKIKYTKQTDPNRGENVLHRWAATKLPPIKRERLMPSPMTQLAWIGFGHKKLRLGKYWGGGESWDQIAAFYTKLSEDRMKKTPYIQRFVTKLTKDAKTKDEKIRKVYNFVRRDIRYIAVTTGLGGWQTQAAEFTLKKRYGDCKAKASLLVAMLSVLGVKANPVLVSTRYRGPMDAKFPSVAFNHAITYLPNYKGGLFVDATTTNNRLELLRWDDQGASALIIDGDKGKFVTIPAFKAEKNLYHRKTTYHYSASKKKITGNVLFKLGGIHRIGWDGMAERGELKSAKGRLGKFAGTAKTLKKVWAKLIFKATGGKIEGVDLVDTKGPHFVMRVRFSMPLKSKKAKKIWVPMNLFAKGALSARGLRKREYHGYLLKGKFQYIDEVVFKGWTPIEYPKSLSINSKHLTYKVDYTHKGRNLHYKRTLTYLKDRLTLAEHNTVRSQGMKIRERDRRLVVLLAGSLDKDKDGTPDDKDRCPTIPGPKKLMGCPDTDGDGIVDIDDKCPNLKGLPNTKDPSKHGCPKVVLVQVTAKEIKILQKIFFAFGRATIRRKSYPVLDQVALVLGSRKKLRVRIEGHTDNVGSKRGNKRLSNRRAGAVLKYLVKKGVAKERLESIGYGMDKPLVKNDTKANRAKNRRVQFTILKGELNPGTDAKVKPKAKP